MEICRVRLDDDLECLESERDVTVSAWIRSPLSASLVEVLERRADFVLVRDFGKG